MKKNCKVLSFDLNNGVYEYVIYLTYGKHSGKYNIYGFSENECESNKIQFVKEWYKTQKELHDFLND